MTLPYALAKQLREAGWPQRSYGGDPDDEYPHPFGQYVEDSETVDTAYSPSLEELMEACPKVHTDERHGDCDLVLYPGEDESSAGYSYGGAFLLLESRGATPKEAIANLWLKLYAKPPS